MYALPTLFPFFKPIQSVIPPAVRFYLPSTATPSISPAFDAGWNVTAGADRRAMVTTKSNSALTVKNSTVNTMVPIQVLSRQYISDPIPAQTISGMVKSYIRAREMSMTLDACAQMIIKVVSNDGSTTRGILLDFSNASLASEFTSGAISINAQFPRNNSTNILNPVVAQANDRIIVEFGAKSFYNNELLNINSSFVLNYGDPSATGDLPEDESTSTALCAWIEFSSLAL